MRVPRMAGGVFALDNNSRMLLLYSLEGVLLNMHRNGIPPEPEKELGKRIQD
jgi:hypothetical protein